MAIRAWETSDFHSYMEFKSWLVGSGNNHALSIHIVHWYFNDAFIPIEKITLFTRWIRTSTTAHHRLFPEKSLKLEKYIFNFFPSPKAGPKPTHQSRSKSTSRVLSQISRTNFFSVFTLTLKLRVVHIRKKLKISNFSKMALTILIKFCGFIEHSKPNNDTIGFSRKNPWN